MPIHDNGDIIRAVGFVAVYGAYLEDRIAEIMKLIEKQIPAIKNKNPPASDQVKHLLKSLKNLFEESPKYSSKDDDLNQILTVLGAIEETLRDRNHMIHSVLISNSAGIVTQKNRRKNSEEQIESQEVIDFANYIFELQSRVFGLKFPIQRLLTNMSKSI